MNLSYSNTHGIKGIVLASLILVAGLFPVSAQEAPESPASPEAIEEPSTPVVPEANEATVESEDAAEAAQTEAVAEEEKPVPAAKPAPVVKPRRRPAPEPTVTRREEEAPPEKETSITFPLTTMDDGSFRYARIPGYGSEENEIADDVETETLAPSTEEEIGGDDKTDPDKGDKKGRADLLAWGTLLLLIAGLFLLYRLRSRKTHSRVVRRFPGQ